MTQTKCGTAIERGERSPRPNERHEGVCRHLRNRGHRRAYHVHGPSQSEFARRGARISRAEDRHCPSSKREGTERQDEFRLCSSKIDGPELRDSHAEICDALQRSEGNAHVAVEYLMAA